MTQKKDQVTAHVQLGGMINYIPCSVEVGEVTTLPAGSDATVTNSGDEHEIVLDFGLPKGDKGEQGEQGDTGKSAYEYAQEQGYEGSEEDFGESLTTIDTKAAQAASAAGAASLSANNANVYATAANNSALEAAQSASNAADSEQNAATSAASAQSHAVNAANSALLAGQAVTSANASASAAATQAANAATSATNAAQMASSASTSASTASAVLEDPDFVAVAGATEDIATVASSVSDISTVAGISEDVSKVADNSADISAVAADLENIDEVATNVAQWQKPADWVDIRSGALPNSVYFLVGHSADYATYPTFGFTATTSEGTYDVFVDGIKQATIASGTATTLDWATLQLASGYTITTPEALVSHIVRVTPSSSTATLTGIKTTLGANYGVLWAHFNVANPINLDGLFNQGSNNDATKRCYVLQAVTSYNGEIQISVPSGIWGAFHYCRVLKEIPTLVYAGSSTSEKSGYRTFRQCYELKKVKLVNFGRISGESTFMSTNVQEIVAENSCFVVKNYCFNDCKKLKKLPPIIPSGNMYLSFTNLANLEPTFVDFSAGTSFQNITFTGDNNNFVSGLKGIVLNPNATATSSFSVAYTGLDRQALVNLFNSMPTISADLVCNITGCTGANDLTAEDLAIATDKGWTVTR